HANLLSVRAIPVGKCVTYGTVGYGNVAVGSGTQDADRATGLHTVPGRQGLRPRDQITTQVPSKDEWTTQVVSGYKIRRVPKRPWFGTKEQTQELIAAAERRLAVALVSSTVKVDVEIKQ